MKKTLLTLSIAIASYCSFAQNTSWSTTASTIGIGTTSPSSSTKLEVDGGGDIIKVYNNAGEYNNSKVLVQNDYGTGSSEVSLTASANQMLIGAQGQSLGDYGGYLNVTSAHPLKFLTNNNERMRIDGVGNVGIGTTSPSFPFDVYKNAVNAGTQLGTTTGFMLSRIYSANYNGGVMFGYDSSTANSGIIAGVNDLQIWGYGSSWGPLAIFKGNGNVGIGTSSPDEKLTVKGTIHSTEVKVTTSALVPDYVFEPDYKLIDLNEVKTYVDVNHRLPEIPSAAQIEKEGINLGDMNMKLLKKVEELTLYLIEQQKQITEQQKINQTLQSQIDQLTIQIK